MFRKNIASQAVYAQMNSRTDGSPLTSSVSINVDNSGGYASGGGTLSHLGNGFWKYTFTQAETNYNAWGFQFTHASGVNIGGTIVATAADPTDATAFGLSRIDAAVSTRASQTSVDTVDDFLDTEIAAIKAKTDNLPSDPADASDIAASFSTVNTKLDTIDDFLDTEVAAIKTKTDNLPANTATELTSISTKIDTVDDFLDTEIAAIKTKTDALPANTASELTTIASKIDTVDDFLDTEIAAIKAKTDNLPAAPAATGDIPSAATIADAVWDEAQSGHTTAGTFGKYLDDEVSSVSGGGGGSLTASDVWSHATRTLSAGVDLSAQAKADVNAEVVDALSTDTHSELTSLPGASPTFKQMVQFVYTILRNKLTTTSSTGTLYRNDGTTSLGTNSVSDDGTTYSKGRFS
jgi:hypothetical protein